MTRAEELLVGNQLAGRVRKAAQKVCAGMSRDHVRNKDVYMFTDGSRIVVCKNKVMLEFTSKSGI
jgi:hypothetical protein